MERADGDDAFYVALSRVNSAMPDTSLVSCLEERCVESHTFLLDQWMVVDVFVVVENEQHVLAQIQFSVLTVVSNEAN